jgi:hypothetical protein
MWKTRPEVVEGGANEREWRRDKVLPAGARGAWVFGSYIVYNAQGSLTPIPSKKVTYALSIR